MPVPTVFLYNLDNPKGGQIKRLCLPLKIRVRTVPPGQYGERLAALAGLEDPENNPWEGEAFSGEMLLMAHFPSGLFHTFLEGFRRKKIVPVALKAILTEHNAGWNSVQLYRELCEEHRAMQEGRTAHGEA